MHGFTSRRGRLVARIDPGERAVVASVVGDVLELLGAPRPESGEVVPVPDDEPGMPRLRTEHVEPPDDPAVRRLLPDASTDDLSVAAEFRRLTEDDLRAQKVDRLNRLWRALTSEGGGRRRDELVVQPDDAPALAGALTDLRLVLAERLGVRSDEDADALYDVLGEPAPGHPGGGVAHETRRYLVSVYGALTWLQESLVVLMLERARTAARGEGDSGEGDTGGGAASD